jgi:hypothetical protein
LESASEPVKQVTIETKAEGLSVESKEPEVLPVMDNMPSFPTAGVTGVESVEGSGSTGLEGGSKQSGEETGAVAGVEDSRPTIQGEALLDPVLKENQQSADAKDDANLNI